MNTRTVDRPLKPWWGSPLVVAAALLGGCGGETPGSVVASVRADLAAHAPARAIVTLKDGLQRRPEWPEARYLLGRALLEGGDAVGAELELRKAGDLGHDADEVTPALARALLLQGKARAVLAQFEETRLTQPRAQSELLTVLAASHLAAGDAEAAARVVAEALSTTPGHPPAVLLKARALASERRFDAAMAEVDGLLAAAASDADALSLKGELLLAARGDAKAAAEAFRQALAQRTDHLGAHTGLILMSLSAGDGDAAARQVDALKKALPRHPQTRFLEAQVTAQRGDLKTAEQLVQQLLGLAPADPSVNTLAGGIELRSGRLRDAETHLKKALQAAPDSRSARLLLARTHLAAGQPGRAMEVLDPLKAKGKSDAEWLLLQAEAHVLAGQPAKAQTFYQAAAKAGPDDPRTRLALATARLSQGQFEAGMADLKALTSDERLGPQAGMALVSAYLAQRRYADALTALESLAQRVPTSPLLAHLRGVAQLELKQAAAARASFEKALELDPGFMVSLQYLAAQDLAEGKPERAVKRFESLLAAQPGHPSATLALAELRARRGASAGEVAKLLAESVQSNPGAARLRLRLIDLHMAARDWNAALTAAQAATAAFPNDAQLLDALGRAQRMAGESNQARSSFGRLATLVPNSPVPYLRLADQSAAEGKVDDAMQQLSKALKLQPGLLLAQRNLLALQLGTGKFADALALARSVQRQRPKDGVGHLFEGDVASARKDLRAAAAAYERGLALQPSVALAMRLHMTHLQAGSTAAADALAARWLQDHPKDIAFVIHLGRVALARQAWTVAQQHFEQVLALDPGNVAALDHLASALIARKLPAALDYARKANELAPGRPELMATEAAALVVANQMPKALALQREVVELAPAAYDQRLTLARMYTDAGDKSRARTELQWLAQVGPTYARQAEVSRLLAAL